MDDKQNIMFQVEGYDSIYTYFRFTSELTKLFKKDRHNAHLYEQWLDRQLHFMDDEPIQFLLSEHPTVFEKIRSFQYHGSTYSIYSIRRPQTSKNLRILFSLIESGSDQADILLLAFSELNQSDYERSIPIAIKRMKDIIAALEENYEPD